MATLYTDIASSDLTLNVRNRNNSDLTHGDLRFAEATYTCTGNEAASGDNIEVCVLPVGAVPVPELWRVANEASLGGSVVAIPKIGDADNDDRYSATSISVNSSTAGSAAVTAAVATSVLPRYTVTEATQRVVAAITRTNAVTAGKKISFLIAYKL
jgi:hypothetical protein